MKYLLYRESENSILNDKHCMEFRYFSNILCEIEKLIGDNNEITFIWTDSKNILPVYGENVVVLHHSDEKYSDLPFFDKVGAVFKQYCKTEYYGENGNVFPLPLNYMPMVIRLPRKPMNERNIDVYFSGENHGKRFEILQNLAQRLNGKCQYWFGRNNSVSLIGPHYSENMVNSKIVLALPGALTNESFRFFEGMMFGNVVLSAKTTNPDHWFYRNNPSVNVDWFNYDETANLILNLLQDNDRMEAISKDSVNFYDGVCREDKIAEYIIWKLKQLNIIK